MNQPKPMNAASRLSFESTAVSLFPHDLSEWIHTSALAQLAREAAATFYWIGTDDEDDAPSFGGCQCPLRKLALLTFCYARGLYSMNEIAACLADDDITLSPAAGGEGRGEGTFAATIHQLCSETQFTADKLRLFRGQNSELLKLSLPFVLRRAWDVRFGEAVNHNGRLDARPHNSVSDHRHTVALRDLLLAEAASRLQRAIFADREMAVPSGTVLSVSSSRREEALTTHEQVAEDQSLVTSAATMNSFAAGSLAEVQQASCGPRPSPALSAASV